MVVEISEVGKFNPDVKNIMGQLMAMYIEDACLCRPKNVYFCVQYTQKGDLQSVSLDYDRGGDRSFTYADWVFGNIEKYGFNWY